MFKENVNNRNFNYCSTIRVETAKARNFLQFTSTYWLNMWVHAYRRSPDVESVTKTFWCSRHGSSSCPEVFKDWITVSSKTHVIRTIVSRFVFTHNGGVNVYQQSKSNIKQLKHWNCSCLSICITILMSVTLDWDNGRVFVMIDETDSRVFWYTAAASPFLQNWHCEIYLLFLALRSLMLDLEAVSLMNKRWLRRWSYCR